MTGDIIALLMQDGVISGAVYALLALGYVLVYAVTRIVFLPQGAFVTFGALTLVNLQDGHFPRLAFFLLALGVAVFTLELVLAIVRRHRFPVATSVLLYLVYPLAIWTICWLLPPKVPMLVRIALTLAIVVPLGPMIYTLVFRPIAERSVLLLLNVAVALDFVLTGIALIVFGGDGFRADVIFDGSFQIGAMLLSAQSICILLVTAFLIVALFIFFERSIHGKALRAVAVNRIGARLVGVKPEFSGRLSFALATLIAAISGILLSSITTVYYNSGFLIGLKGLVAAIMGGLVSYPLAAAGAIIVGVVESFAAFWSSGMREAIVFTLLIPILIWRSMSTVTIAEEDE